MPLPVQFRLKLLKNRLVENPKINGIYLKTHQVNHKTKRARPKASRPHHLKTLRFLWIIWPKREGVLQRDDQDHKEGVQDHQEDDQNHQEDDQKHRGDDQEVNQDHKGYDPDH